MGGEQTLAETVGRAENQADREEQRAGGSTETNQSSQGDASTVCKLSQHSLRPSSQLLLLAVFEGFHCTSHWMTLYGRSECWNISESASDSPFLL